MRTNDYFDPEIETMKPGDLRPLQQAKLAGQLDYLIARSPFYRDKFAAAGVRREDFRSLEDLAHFPFTTKEELRESQRASPPLGRHMAADMIDVIRLHASTGTTGLPSFVGLTRKDAEIWTKVTARSFYTQGIRPSDILIHAASLTMFAAGLPANDPIELIATTSVPLS